MRTFYAGQEPLIMIDEILDELVNARDKFPAQDDETMFLAMAEECGELVRAFLRYRDEPETNVSYDDIRKEATQVAAMAIRCILDTTLVRYNPYGKGVW